MKIPIITGVIDRRILINYQIDRDVLVRFLPKPFKPKLIKGKGIAGICLIRLKDIRPKGFPKSLGISSENGAHRIAVEWEENGVKKEGVYIPRRDTSSRINAWAGGRIFPGIHHLANFEVQESKMAYVVQFQSRDGTYLSIKARETNSWNQESIFEDLDCVSDFFQKGLIGYSPGKDNFQGLELRTYNWSVSPLEVEHVSSSFFENEEIFPLGSVTFDNALLMKHIYHEWIDHGAIS